MSLHPPGADNNLRGLRVFSPTLYLPELPSRPGVPYSSHRAQSDGLSANLPREDPEQAGGRLTGKENDDWLAGRLPGLRRPLGRTGRGSWFCVISCRQPLDRSGRAGMITGQSARYVTLPPTSIVHKAKPGSGFPFTLRILTDMRGWHRLPQWLGGLPASAQTIPASLRERDESKRRGRASIPSPR